MRNINTTRRFALSTRSERLQAAFAAAWEELSQNHQWSCDLSRARWDAHPTIDMPWAPSCLTLAVLQAECDRRLEAARAALDAVEYQLL